MESSTTPEDAKNIQLLAKGILEIYEPPLATINTHLRELTHKGGGVIVAETPDMFAAPRPEYNYHTPTTAGPCPTIPDRAGLKCCKGGAEEKRLVKCQREKQDSVQNMLSSERRKLEDLQNDAMLDALLADITTNKEKLTTISNSMITLHKRVQSLQVRAANVEKAAKAKAASQSNASASGS